jgi:hypothetical protein
MKSRTPRKEQTFKRIIILKKRENYFSGGRIDLCCGDPQRGVLPYLLIYSLEEKDILLALKAQGQCY